MVTLFVNIQKQNGILQFSEIFCCTPPLFVWVSPAQKLRQKFVLSFRVLKEVVVLSQQKKYSMMVSFIGWGLEPFEHPSYIIISVPLARISLVLSRHFSLSFITSGRSSGLHPLSSHSCCMYVRAGRPAFARPYVGVHRSTSLMSSSLILQSCPICPVRLTWIVFVMVGRWLYSWRLVGCCRQDLLNIDPSILV